MRPAGVLCCGSIVYDTLVKPVGELDWSRATSFVDCIAYHGGGNGARHTLRALGILGIPVRLLGAVGADEQGTLLIGLLEQAGVETKYVTRVSAPTAASVALVNSSGERKFFHRPGASNQAFTEPIAFSAELCGGASHFHLASFFLLPHLRARGPDVLIRAREAGLTTSFDTNWDPRDAWMSALEPCLCHLDLLFMNEDEARMTTGCADPAGSASVVLNRGVPVCVIKLGSRGCAIYTNEREIVCPAFEVEAKDTTGAGDCFVAGFLAARQRGASLAEAGQFANAIAALSVQQIGAVEGVLPLAETQAWMRGHKLK